MITDPLHVSIDKAGQEMLERCAREVDGRPIPMSQQVEAFVAIVKWAEVREKIKPKQPEPEKKETKFERLNREFHGKRRGRPPKPGPDEIDDGADERGADSAEGPPAPQATAHANGAAAADQPPGRPAFDNLLDNGDALDG